MQLSSIKRFSALALANLTATVGSLSPAVEARPTTNAVIQDASEAVVNGKDFKVNTSREVAQRISGGAFGSLSVQRSDLNVEVEAVYR